MNIRYGFKIIPDSRFLTSFLLKKVYWYETNTHTRFFYKNSEISSEPEVFLIAIFIIAILDLPYPYFVCLSWSIWSCALFEIYLYAVVWSKTSFLKNLSNVVLTTHILRAKKRPSWLLSLWNVHSTPVLLNSTRILLRPCQTCSNPT